MCLTDLLAQLASWLRRRRNWQNCQKSGKVDGLECLPVSALTACHAHKHLLLLIVERLSSLWRLVDRAIDYSFLGIDSLCCCGGGGSFRVPLRLATSGRQTSGQVQENKVACLHVSQVRRAHSPDVTQLSDVQVRNCIAFKLCGCVCMRPVSRVQLGHRNHRV